MLLFFTRHKLLLLHISFWVLFISYRFFDYSQFLSYDKVLILIGVPLFFNLATSYIHYLLLLPLLIDQKKIFKYTLLLVLTLGGMTAMRIWADIEFMVVLTPDSSTYYTTISFARIASILWDFLTFLIFTSMIKFTADWFYLENKRRQLENEKLTAELNYLKSQINPHFLFNTLHNLNYLTLQKRNEASDVIIRLSNIMRYMIYDASKNMVSIRKELQYMKDYIELERIRLNESFNITFDVQETTHDVQIAPLLLITLLENAFKHGVNDKYSDCWIAVTLTYNEDSINYSVQNSKVDKKLNQERSGFGLTNLKKRLKLHYPQKHDLSTYEDEKEFEIVLKISLEND